MIVSIALLLLTMLLMYLLSEINTTRSSYGIRRLKSLTEYQNNRYYSWFREKESQLEELYEQELCEEMTLSFEEFCWAIYNEFEIIYA